MHKCSQLPTAEELHSKIDDMLDETGNFDEFRIRRVIRRYIRYAKMMNDIGKVSDYRIQLGHVYLSVNKLTRGGKQFRMVLRDDPTSIDAVIGIANSYSLSGYPSKSRQWLEKARIMAENAHDNAKHIEILDDIAWHAVSFQHDFSGLDDLYSKMCSLLETAPEMDNIPLSSVRALLYENQVSYAIPYLESLVKYFVLKGSSRGAMQIVFRYYVEARRQMGFSDDVIMEELKTFEHLAPNEQAHRSFIEILNRSFWANQYPVFP